MLALLLQAAPSETEPLPAEPQPAAVVADADTTGILCDGLVVSAVEVETWRPQFTGPMAIWRRVARQLGLHNTETAEGVVRRYVTLQPGATCTEFRRAESERLLRAQPFIATASVRAERDGAGGVRLLVRTVDEVPALVAARYRKRDWALALGNENTFGSGTRVLLRMEQRDHYRDGYGAEFEHRQLFGRPWVLGLQAVQHPLGERWHAELGHAFLTDLQRIAWHAGASRRVEYARLGPDRDGATLVLQRRQNAWDVGGVFRLGPAGRTFLSGGVLTGERVTPGDQAVLVTDTGLMAASPEDATVADRFAPVRNVRANLIGGFRAIQYRQARGFDALTAEQDLANGLQASVFVGRSIPGISDESDGFLATEVFIGAGGARSYAAMQVDGEARRSFEEGGDWDGILGSARAAWYFKPAERFTSIASAEWAGAWRERFPFLLELGDRQGGVRGFAGADVFGSRRAVARLEERYIIGPVKRRGDLGVAVFTEAGRVWAGDAPFGETSPVASSVGLSLLATVPMGGQRLYRVDVALPVSGPGGRGVEVRFGATDRTRHFWDTPDDVMRARAAATPRRILDWP